MNALNQVLSYMLSGKFALGEELMIKRADAIHIDDMPWLKSCRDFWMGRIFYQPSPRWETFFHQILTKYSLLLGIYVLVMRMFGIFLRVLRLDDKVFRYILRERLPRQIHFRYSNFSKLTIESVAFEAMGVLNDPLWRAANRAAMCHGLCLSGRCDLGLPRYYLAVQELSEIHRRINVSDIVCYKTFAFYVEYLAGYIFHLSFAGNHEEVRKQEKLFFAEIRRHPAFWPEIFLRSMRIVSSIEMIDESHLQEDADRLQLILGERYQEKFGLRASCAAAYLAQVRGDSDTCHQALINAEYYYELVKVPMELYRYHEIRSLVQFELKDVNGARFHAERALALVNYVPGAIMHSVEAQLSYCEALLKCFVWSGVDASKLVDIKKRLRMCRSRVRGSEYFDCKIAVLYKIIHYLEHDFAAVADDKLMAQAERVSRKTAMLYQGFIANSFVKTSENVQLGAYSFAREKSIISMLNKLPDVGNCYASYCEIVREVFNAEECHKIGMIKKNSPQRGEKYAIERDDAGTLVFQAWVDEGECVAYALVKPRIDVKFDRRSDQYLQLVCTLIRDAAMKKRLIEANRHEAIAKTTQMLAHDVRKPFTMLQMVLNDLESAKSFADVSEVIAASKYEVSSALVSVNAMLEDIVDVGADIRLDKSELQIDRLVDEVFLDVGRLLKKQKIMVRGDFSHKSRVMVDHYRMRRVLTNIVSNAIEAMRDGGDIWMQSHDSVKRPGFVEIIIGNSGSEIRDEDIGSLFDAFYTKNKRGGSGLGLAIAKKMVGLHDGTIQCTSGLSSVVFTIEIPSTTEPMTTQPQSFAAVDLRSISVVSGRCRRHGDGSFVEKEDLSLVMDELERKLGSRVLQCLIVDDEDLYRQHLRRLFASLPGASRFMNVTIVASMDDVQLLSGRYFDVLVTDLDLGNQSLDGVDVIRTMRSQMPHLQVCVHSNRSACDIEQLNLIDGDFHVLPKPGERILFARYLLDCVKNMCRATPVKSLSRIAVIDDSPLQLKMWQNKNRDKEVVTFLSPSAFWDSMKDAQDTGFDLIITDLYFDDDSVETGIDVAQRISGVPVYLSTNADMPGTPPMGVVKVLSKKVLSWDELEKLAHS